MRGDFFPHICIYERFKLMLHSIYEAFPFPEIHRRDANKQWEKSSKLSILIYFRHSSYFASFTTFVHSTLDALSHLSCLRCCYSTLSSSLHSSWTFMFKTSIKRSHWRRKKLNEVRYRISCNFIEKKKQKKFKSNFSCERMKCDKNN